MRAGRLLTATVAGALVLTPASALASPTDPSQARIAGVQETDAGVQLAYSATGLPSGTGLDPETVSAEFTPDGGSTVPLEATAAPADGAGVRQRVILALDVSGSLGQSGIAAVRDAATQFLTELPDDVEVGLVTFGRPAESVLDPTADHDAVQAEIDDLDLNGDTALYDAVQLATGMLDGEGSESIVLMTDGQDEGRQPGSIGSVATLDEATQSVGASGARLTAVAFGDADADSLEQLVAASGGDGVVPADDEAALIQALQDIGEDIATEVVVDVDVPDSLRGADGVLVVAVAADDLETSAEWTGTLGTAVVVAPTPTPTPTPEPTPEPSENAVAAPPPPSTLGFLGPVALYIALGALFLALLVVALVLVGLAASRNSPEAARERSLQVYTLRGGNPGLVEKQTSSTRLGDNAVARSAVDFAGRVVDKRQTGDRLGQQLDAAGIPLRPAEWVVLHTVSTLGTGMLLLLLSGGNALAMIIGLVLGFVVPRLLMSFRRGRRERAFLERLPDTLGLLASGLRAGYSMPQAMDSVAREGQEPIKSEFNRALVEARLGVPPEEALESIATRVGSQDFRWVVMAIRIQREVGGNLAELLDTVAGTLRERARIKRQVQTLAAEGKLSSWIVGCLPVLFALYLGVTQPEYLRPLYTDILGIALSVVALLMFVIGLFGLRWATKVDV